VSNGFSLFGENKAAAEIRSGLGRPASASHGGRNLSSAGSLILENKAAAATKAEDFVPLKKLGQGASGLVHLAQLKEDGSHWVLKQVELGRASSAPSSERSSLIARAERDNVLREVKLMSSIKNENLIKFCTSFLHQTTGGPQSVFIVMEYAQRGALSDYIKQIRSTASHADELFVWRCMLQVGCGLAAIHAHRVIHRDIKSANILITANEHFKIADLGIAVSTSLCNVQGRMRTGRCGTMGYTAPEVSNDMPYDARSDMWSLGCVLYEVACHRVPFPSGTVVDTDVRCEAGISMQDITDAANALQLPHTYSDLLNNHVLWCLVVDASGRPSARQLISTQDTIRKAVELKITLPDGFEFPLTNQDEERVEYGGELPVDKRRPRLFGPCTPVGDPAPTSSVGREPRL
jgi:NIMA (never in mitosis gene a)-related kinase